MTKSTYGYPMIFEWANTYLVDALSCLIRETPTYGTFTAGGIEAQAFAPRLDNLEIKPGSGGVSLEAKFHVASGRLTVNGQALRDYVLKGALTPTLSGTSINLEIDTGQLTIATTSTPVPAGLAKKLGFSASLTLDLTGLHLGRWALTPKEAALQTDGTRTSLGVLLDIRHGSKPFPDPPQKDEQAFQTYKAIKAGDWGYLIDRSLVPVLLNEMKQQQEASGRLRDMQLKLDTMSGPNDFEVSGSGEAFEQGGWHSFTLKAKAWLRIDAGQIKAHWMAIDREAIRNHQSPRWWIKLWGAIDVTERVAAACPTCVQGSFNTRLPIKLGDAQSDLGELTITALGGSGQVVLFHGDGTTVPCDNAAIEIEPPAPPIYVTKGKSASLILSNPSAAVGRRRATLRVFHPRLENAGADIKLDAPQEMQVAPGKSTKADDIKIKYTGTGSARGDLVLPNNDSQQIVPIHAYETAGRVKVAPTNVPLTAYDPGQASAGGPVGASRNATATVTIAHAGGCPVRCRISLHDPSGFIVHHGPTGSFVLDKGQSQDVRLTFNAIGLTAEKSFAASLHVYTESGNHSVSITARVTRPPAYIPGWRGRRLEMARHLSEIRPLMMSARQLLRCMARRPEELLSESQPSPSPPWPPRPYVKMRFANLPDGTSLSLETDGHLCFQGEAHKDSALLIAPLLDCEDVLLSLEGMGDPEVGITVERWDVAQLGAEELETPVRGLAWKDRQLHVAGPEGLYTYTVYPFGNMRPIAAHPSFADATAVHAAASWLFVSTPGELLIAVAPSPQEVEVVGSLPLDGDESVPLTTSLDGRLFVGQHGTIDVYDLGSLPQLESLATVDDLALGRELFLSGPRLISMGEDGICIFRVDAQVPEIHDHHPVGPVSTALRFGESLVLRTAGDDLLVLDLGRAEPVIAGRIEAELPDDDALRCPSFLRFGPAGLLVGPGDYEEQIRIYRLVQYRVDEEYVSYYLAEQM
jgi:hypothetical protein